MPDFRDGPARSEDRAPGAVAVVMLSVLTGISLPRQYLLRQTLPGQK
jgi:hypothetical protein